jgi:PAS domain S-box-containing protein
LFYPSSKAFRKILPLFVCLKCEIPTADETQVREKMSKTIAIQAEPAPQTRFLDNISIGRKLLLIGAVFVIPTAFLLYSDFAARNQAIVQDNRNIEGSQALNVVNGTWLTVNRNAAERADRLAQSSTDTGASLDKARAAIQELVTTLHNTQRFEIDPGTVARVELSVTDFLDAAGELNTEALFEESSAIHDNFVALVNAVDEQSGLLLNQDITANYVIEILSDNLPEVSSALSKLDLHLNLIRSKTAASPAELSKLQALTIAYTTARDNLLATIGNIHRTNADGTVKAATDADFEATKTALAAYGRKIFVALDNMGMSNRSTLDIPVTTEERNAAFDATEKLRGTVSAELSRLLNQQIKSAQGSLYTNLGLAALFVALALGAIFYIGREISGSLKSLAKVMARLAGDQAVVEVPYQNRGDELGEMAKAVLVFKDRGIDRLRLAAALPAQQKALADSELRLRSLVRNIPGVAVRTKADADRSVEFISDNIETIVGYSANDFLTNGGRTLASLIHPEDLAEYKRVVTESIVRNRPFTTEYRMLNKQGDVRWISEKGQIVMGEGAAAYIDSHFVDRFAREDAAPATAAIRSVSPAPLRA